MLKNIIRGEYVTERDYALEYTDRMGNGFSFPCDESGNPLGLTDAALKNLEWCRNNTDKFEYPGIVKTYKRRYREPTTGTCSCGETVELWDQYMGACECPRCGKWYNLFGQELLHPKYWEEDNNEDW